jgi:hypothetical protein
MTNLEKIQIGNKHWKRVSELFLAKYPTATDFAKTDKYFWNKCREKAAKELGLI